MLVYNCTVNFWLRVLYTFALRAIVFVCMQLCAYSKPCFAGERREFESEVADCLMSNPTSFRVIQGRWERFKFHWHEHHVQYTPTAAGSQHIQLTFTVKSPCVPVWQCLGGCCTMKRVSVVTSLSLKRAFIQTSPPLAAWQQLLNPSNPFNMWALDS